MIFDLFYTCTGVCTDTRKITKDCLFICLKGENFNGNLFAKEALQKGAKYVICDEEKYANDTSIFYVPDALKYLQKIANIHRKKMNIPVLGITGSNGKTTTKELVAQVLKQKFKVLFTEGNLNNHIGVPLTLLRLQENHEFAIIEMGANKFKDIEELCAIAEPNYGIISNIGKAHLEGFINFEGVIRTKKELYDSILLNQGELFVNQDDSILTSILPDNIQIHTYASKSNADIKGELIELTPFVKLKWETAGYQSPVIQTKMIGEYNFTNFLAAICIGHYFGVPSDQINKAIESYESTNNRSQLHKTERNTLILDAYNANPSSMQSAIRSFSLIENDSKLLILGDMFELGPDSESEHSKIIELNSELGNSCIYIGKNFYALAQSENFFENKEAFISYNSENPISSKLILLKGSRGIGLEALVPYL